MPGSSARNKDCAAGNGNEDLDGPSQPSPNDNDTTRSGVFAVSERDRHPHSWRFLLGRVRHALSERELDIVEGLIENVEHFSGQHRVLERGDVVNKSTLLIEGFVARVIERDGKRHIVAIHVPGDFVDLHGFALKRLDHSVVTIGTARLGYVSHDRLTRLLAEEPHLARLLWFSTLLDAAIHREWILKLEQLNADGRLAHLIAELWHRLDFVGLADPMGFAFPLTQVELADACGTTAIHLNRVVRQLREHSIADISRGRITIFDMDRLKELGQFERSYLYGDGMLQIQQELGPPA